MRWVWLALPLLLSTCYAAPAYAHVFDSVWDGVCIPIHQSPYMKINPDSVNPYQGGSVPSERLGSNEDIRACIPETVKGGPK